MESNRPLYGAISQNGARFTITYYPEKAFGGCLVTGSRQGYDLEVFEKCPDNMIIIDYRSASLRDILDFVRNNSCPGNVIRGEEDEADILDALNQYVYNARQIGCTITQVKNLTFKTVER